MTIQHLTLPIHDNLFFDPKWIQGFDTKKLILMSGRQPGKTSLNSVYYSKFFDKNFRRYIPIGKGRKGKPHWRHFRALRCDSAWKTQWDNILTAYDDWLSTTEVGYKPWRYQVDEILLTAWLKPQLVNCTIRRDPLYKNCLAIDFDDEAARTQFFLTWA